MRVFRILPATSLVVWMLAGLATYALAADPQTGPKRVRDILWVWGNPELAKEGPHTLATFVEANSAQRARLLGVANVVMAGMGLPNDDAKADALTKRVAGFKRLVWETTPDGEGIGPPFIYKSRMAQIRRLVDRYGQLEGVLLDDMSTGKIDRGFKPEHVRHIRQQLSGKYKSVKIWGVVYTMSLDRPGMNDYIRAVDVLNLWEWHAKRLGDLEKHVAHCEKLFPDKPIVLGLYLYDYGGGRKIPLDLLQLQCETALKLAHAGRIEGIVLLTINNDPEALRWTAEWIHQVGNQQLGSPPAESPTPKADYRSRVPGSTSPTWIEGGDGTILMSLSGGGRLRIAISRDEGRSWEVISTVGDAASGEYFTRLAGGELLLVVTTGGEKRQIAWVRSRDNGRTWSPPTPIIARRKSLYSYGPICVMQDGRWAYCPYHQTGDKEFRALLMWSEDKGKTWSEPIAFSTPADGNKGLTECTVVQLGPKKYLAAIRADEGDEGAGAFDGFYLSRSEDGLRWSVPKSLDERGRMPLFYRIGDVWALAYRLYDSPKKTQYSAVRFSRHGQQWSQPWIIESGVNVGPQLVRVGKRIVAFNTLYPATNTMTRHVVTLPQQTTWPADGGNEQ